MSKPRRTAPRRNTNQPDTGLRHRVMLSLNDEDYAKLAAEAEEKRLPIATYARVKLVGTE